MSPTRRTLLTAGSTLLLSPLAGCSFANDGRQQIPVQLRNETDAEHDFEVRVRYMDDALLDAEQTLAGGESTSYRFANPDERETVTVAAQIDQEQETSERVDIGTGSGTEFISVVLQDDGPQILVAVE